MEYSPKLSAMFSMIRTCLLNFVTFSIKNDKSGGRTKMILILIGFPLIFFFLNQQT